jgi:ethanolamine utilization protein EutS
MKGRKMDWLDDRNKQRIVQELVPGKQITLAHIIASPDPILYEKLGLDPGIDYARAAIGIMTVSPAETAIIMADVGMKAASIDLGFVDRFSGSLIISGTVSEVEASEQAILDYVRDVLKYTVCQITRT